MIEPRLIASATLKGVGDGQLVIESYSMSLSVVLAPFIRGEKGENGAGLENLENFLLTLEQAQADFERVE